MSDASDIALHVQRPDLVEQIDWLVPYLPQIRPIKLRGEADYYGASHELAKKVGLDFPPTSQGTWAHGWSYLPLVSGRTAVGYAPSERTHLVPTLFHQEFLHAAGYPNAAAVGVPYLYAAGKDVLPRRPDSVLLAPLHSLPEIKQHEDKLRNEEEFAEYALSLRGHFSCVCASIHSSCVRSRQWIDSLERRGIPWVTGAMTDDANGLRRVRTLLNAFEVLVTNQVGSALFYAALDGARVSVSGPDALLPPLDSYKNHPYFIANPEMIEKRKLGHPDRMRERFPALFVDAKNAVQYSEEAAVELGLSHLIDHAEVARLLGWCHCDADPDWRAEDREKARRVFGWMPSHYGSSASMEELGRTLKKLDLDAGAAAQKLHELKGLEKEAKVSAKAHAELSGIKTSWAWRYLAKPIFSIEKRLRGWK